MHLIVAVVSLFLIKRSIAFSTSEYLLTLSRHIFFEETTIRRQVESFDERRHSSSNVIIPPRNEYEVPNLDQISAVTPADHYAKHNPGAGWAGYNHPLYGGYLKNLKQNNL